MPLTSVRITIDNLRRELIQKIEEHKCHEFPTPLLNIIAEYWTPTIPKWEGTSYYSLSKGYGRSKKPPNNIKIRFGMDKNDLNLMLEQDHIDTIEMTQDANQGGEYYRAHVRSNSRATEKIRGEQINPSIVFEIVPYGCPQRDWQLPLGGPNIRETNRGTLWKLSNGAVFYIIGNGEFQFRIVRMDV
jgi:hypothetical protein